MPEDRGRLVTAFLSSFFERYVEYTFPAQLEDQLDDVSGGRIDWKELLRNFWRDFSSAVDGTKDLTIKAVLEALDAGLGPHFFPEDGSGSGRDPRLCPACAAGRLSLKLGRFGAFIGCSNYPECRYTRAFGVGGETEGEPAGGADILLGNDPATGLSVTVKKGPYGHYIQLGDSENGNKPKRVALPRSIKPADVDLETALGLLALPREVGRHPETGETIIAGIGRFGPYLKHGSSFVSLPADDDVLNVGLNRAVTLLAEAKAGSRRARRRPQHRTAPRSRPGAPPQSPRMQKPKQRQSQRRRPKRKLSPAKVPRAARPPEASRLNQQSCRPGEGRDPFVQR